MPVGARGAEPPGGQPDQPVPFKTRRPKARPKGHKGHRGGHRLGGKSR